MDFQGKSSNVPSFPTDVHGLEKVTQTVPVLCTRAPGSQGVIICWKIFVSAKLLYAADLISQKICASVPAGNTSYLLHLSFHQRGNTCSNHYYNFKILSHFKHQHKSKPITGTKHRPCFAKKVRDK